MTTDAKQAPGDLALVGAFVNTRDLDVGDDDIGTPEALRDWLVQRGLLQHGDDVSAEEVALAQQIREALRELLLVNNHGGAPTAAALELLGDASRRSGLWVRFDEHGDPTLEAAATGATGALGKLLAVVYDARREGTWPRLKACREDTCQWAFYDRSKNSSRHWCSMEVCGSRNKARAYRRRHGGGAGET